LKSEEEVDGDRPGDLTAIVYGGGMQMEPAHGRLQWLALVLALLASVLPEVWNLSCFTSVNVWIVLKLKFLAMLCCHRHDYCFVDIFRRVFF
jgi:hypothetical protein